MKVAIAQQNYIIGDFKHNLAKIKQAIQQAHQMDADIVLFGELVVCGYPPRDFLEFNDFIDRCNAVIQQIKQISIGLNMAIVLGCPFVNPVPEGKDLFNAAYFIVEGEIKQVIHKSLLPTYDIFDEYRYFEPGKNVEVVRYKGKKIAITICEDIWDIGAENPLYTGNPMDNLIMQQPDFMLNLSASPFSYQHAEEREFIVKSNVNTYKIPMFYTNVIGGQTEILFDGGSLVVNDSGMIVDEMPYFEECIRVYETAELIDSKGFILKDNRQNRDKMNLIYRALLMGIRDYFGKLGFSKAILGLSGGIDSAVTLVLAAHALGSENVRAVLLPSQFSSDHSVSDAVQLAKNLGCSYDIIPIQSTFESFQNNLQKQFLGLPFGLAEENLQARIRGTLLMALSNKLGYIVLNTSNKSEAAVGYGTLYGDMCGGLSVLGDVYKTEVFALARYLNRNGEVIPEHTITKPPSAELRPNQKDSDSLPAYEELDKVLYHYIEEQRGPKEIVALGFDKKLVDRTLRLVNRNEYKRYQTAPILRVSGKAFGMGRRMPIVAKYLE